MKAKLNTPIPRRTTKHWGVQISRLKTPQRYSLLITRAVRVLPAEHPAISASEESVTGFRFGAELRTDSQPALDATGGMDDDGVSAPCWLHSDVNGDLPDILSPVTPRSRPRTQRPPKKPARCSR